VRVSLVASRGRRTNIRRLHAEAEDAPAWLGLELEPNLAPDHHVNFTTWVAESLGMADRCGLCTVPLHGLKHNLGNIA
jgi:sugar phosphate isomerase/epimerase